MLVVFSYLIMLNIRKRRVLKFGNFSTLKRIEGTKRFHISPALILIKMFMVTLLYTVATHSITISLMKPVPNTDFVFCIDTSYSMSMDDYQPNRLEMVKNNVQDWIKRLPLGTYVGIVAFSDNGRVITPLTNSYTKIKEGIESISLSTTSSGTSLSNALIIGSSLLGNSKKNKVIVLITDGKNNFGPNISDVITDMRNRSIVVYTVGIGNNERTTQIYEKMKSVLSKSKLVNQSLVNLTQTFELPELDEATLIEIARSTGGKYFRINETIGFETTFNKVFIKNERIKLDSDYYVLLFLALLTIIELLIFAKYGAI